MQNILNHEQIIDDDSKILTIALGEGFRPFGLFCGPYLKNIISQCCSMVIQDHFLHVHIKR